MSRSKRSANKGTRAQGLLSCLSLTLCLAVAWASPSVAQESEQALTQIVVSYKPGYQPEGQPANRPLVIESRNAWQTAKRLSQREGVRYAVPNLIARASSLDSDGFMPNDPDMQRLQWNFLDEYGVGASQAWANLIAVGRPGGQGVTVAVLDTGVAYSNRPPYKRSPDFTKGQFIRGYDFIGKDKYPHDSNGHGTHVAGTIAEATNNGIAVAGLAYGAKIMPVRVLDSYGEGNAADIARAIRYAADHGAQVINLSLEFDGSVKARQIPQVIEAIRYATQRGSLVVGSSGNEGRGRVSYPARTPEAIAVGATTAEGCRAEYSNHDNTLDLVAPGGGLNAGLPGCSARFAGKPIYQTTLTSPRRNKFGLPGDYEGTSMAAPHVSATAALVIASGVLGPRPTPEALADHLRGSTRDLGDAGYDRHYGAGLIDAAAATQLPE